MKKSDEVRISAMGFAIGGSFVYLLRDHLAKDNNGIVIPLMILNIILLIAEIFFNEENN